MINEYTPLTPEYKISGNIRIFLDGTIDNGKSFDWQSYFIKYWNRYNASWDVFNPRFDKTHDDNFKPDNTELIKQINWEQIHLKLADVIIFNLLPNSLSPISLMELGEYGTDMYKDIHVVCPQSFWRSGNVWEFCKRYDIPVYPCMDDLNDYILKYLI